MSALSPTTGVKTGKAQNQQTFSGLPPKADIDRRGRHVRLVAEAEVAKFIPAASPDHPVPYVDAIRASAVATDISRRSPAVQAGCDSLHRHGHRQYGQSGRSRMSQVREESTCRRHFV